MCCLAIHDDESWLCANFTDCLNLASMSLLTMFEIWARVYLLSCITMIDVALH